MCGAAVNFGHSPAHFIRSKMGLGAGGQAQDIETTTVISTKVFTAQTCRSAGLINCPASLQESLSYNSVLTGCYGGCVHIASTSMDWP